MSEDNIDKDLVRQVLTGDKEAFDVLVIKYQPRLRRVIAKIVDSEPAVVGDLVQETFINAFRALKHYAGRSNFYTWLYRIAVNTAKNYLRYKASRPSSADFDISEVMQRGKSPIWESATPERLLHRDEVETAVMNAVNRLPDELRIAIVLREIAGLTYAEIAGVMHCPIGTVRSRIFRARNVVDAHIKPLLNFD